MAVSTRETAGGSIWCHSGRQTSLQTPQYPRYFKSTRLRCLLALCWVLAGAAQAGNGTDPNGRGPDDAFVAELTAKAIAAKAEAINWAQRYGFAVRSEEGGREYELMALSDGRPMYYATGNVQAAISTAADRIRDLSAWNLDGAGIVVGVWDAGGVRFSHQEFQQPGAGSRVNVGDIVPHSKHSTHVGGTIGAMGKDPLAKGMAPATRIDSFDWNYDAAKMANRAAYAPQGFNRIYISNHSYGLLAGWAYASLYGNTGWFWTAPWEGRDSTEPWFGQYHEVAADWDDVAYRYPYYLAFVAAGNERMDNPPIGEKVYYLIQATAVRSIIYDPNTCPPGDGLAKEGYDTLPGSSTAKNLMTVGAVGDAVSQRARSLADANMAIFGSWGPTDDGRIKPDIVANGIDVYSTDANSDTSYETHSGTSMACPNATGSATLLIQLYQRLFPSQNMRSSTLKGLIVHTADDLGRPGPDYQFGWGLMNARAAAELIQRQHDDTIDTCIIEGVVDANTPRRTYFFLAQAGEPVRVTLCWTDPPGTPRDVLDSPQRQLVHDLDLRIFGPDGSTMYCPYVLNPAAPRTVASAGDNNVDNVEQIYVGALNESGLHRIEVTYKGQLTKPEQYYSLISSVPIFRQSPPLAKDATVIMARDKSVTITLSATDDGLPKPPGKLTYVIASLPSHGTLATVGGAAITQPGPLAAYANQVVYTPNVGYTGYDTFTFYADDGGTVPQGGTSNTARVAVAVRDIITVEYQICAGEDDGTASRYDQWLDEPFLRMGWMTTYTIAMRFQDVAVPPNAEIVSANLRLFLYAAGRGMGSIYTEATGNAASLTDRAFWQLPKTYARVDWNWSGEESHNAWHSSPDMRSIVQKVIDREDWSAGNALMVVYSVDYVGSGDAKFYAYESGRATAPRLVITYSPELDEPHDAPVVPGTSAPAPAPSKNRPVAQDEDLYVCSNNPTVILLTATDKDPGTILSYGIASLPSHGTLEYQPYNQATVGTVLAESTKRVVYRADAGFSGEDSFTFFADDGATPPTGGKSNVATVTLKVRHMVTREYEVIAPEDNAYGAPGEPVAVSDMLGVGKSTSAMRFRNIDLSQGDEIISAYLSICMSTTSIDKRIDAAVYAEATGDANDFNEPGLRVANLPKTKASVPWVWQAGQTWTAQTYSSSPDIHAVIQEIVNREDWAISNDIAILYAGGAQNTQDLQFYACDKPYSTRAARLQITYAVKPGEEFCVPVKSHPPIAEDVNATTISTDPVTIALKARDDSLPNVPGQLAFAIVSLPGHGTLEYFGGGQITGPAVLPGFDHRLVYQAQKGFEGEDSFTFNADDGGTAPTGGKSNTATVRVTVTLRQTTVSYSVKVSEDDAFGRPTLLWNDVYGSLLKVGVNTSAMRFIGVKIPKGSKIVKAELKIGTAKDLYISKLEDCFEGVLQGEATGNAANFSSPDRLVHALPRTGASVAWALGLGSYGNRLSSPDISAVVQEIVDRPDWSEGNAIAIIFSSTGTREKDFEFCAFDFVSGSGRVPPGLVVTYAK